MFNIFDSPYPYGGQGPTNKPMGGGDKTNMKLGDQMVTYQT